MLLSALPRLPLGRFPTPIEPLRGLLPDALGVDLWVKREDHAGPLYGGNKVRKLEHLLAGIPGGARVLTSGGYGSHHVLATALYGRAQGLQVAAVLYPQPRTPRVEATLRCDQAAGAELFPARWYLSVPLQVLRALRGRPHTHLLAPGGSSPLGSAGWVAGGREIAAQVARDEAPRFDAVYVALGSGGMAAGLWLGLGDAAAALVAVPVVPAIVGNSVALRYLAWRTQRLLHGEAWPPRPRLIIRRGFLGAGYGHETAAAQEALALAAAAGLTLEPTYTGKTLAALIADARGGRLAGKRVLFIHSYNGVDLTDLVK